jgi:NodT family efflux transporter outer membrane factor (OMF) lipoprotein
MKAIVQYYIVLVTVLLCSCRTVKLPETPIIKPVPDSFIGNTDSIESSSLTKHYFFRDTHLKNLIDSAVSNNTDLLNAYQHIEIAKANTRFANGQRSPFVNAVFAPSLRKFGLYTMDGAGNATTDIKPGQLVPVHLPDYYIGLQSAWEPDIYGKLKDQVKASSFRYLSTMEGKKWIEANLVNTIAVNYYELQSMDAQLLIIKQSIALQEQILSSIKVQKEAAKTTELAINQFEAQILNARGSVKEIEQAIIENENNINLLLSRYPAPIIRSSNWLEEDSTILRTGIPSQLLRNRPDIQMAEYELIASKYDLQVARKQFYPSISLNATIGLQAFSPASLVNSQSISYGLFGGLLAPIFNRTALQAQFKTQQSLQVQALNNYQQVMLTAFGEVVTCLKKVDKLKEMIALKAQESAVMQKAIENARLLFQANRASYLEVLSAQQNMLDAKLSYIALKSRRNQEMAYLFKALGGGWR